MGLEISNFEFGCF